DVFAVTGAFLMIRRSIFNRLGGFDRMYDPGTFEDVDLCLRVRQLGLRIICVTEATGYHYAGATQEKKRFGYPLQMNMMKFTSKWAQSGMIFWSDWEFYST
ncbi:MAG TPA: glycosyltransferase family 2 protein, partial [Candidatus Paceibacterota bacterium]